MRYNFEIYILLFVLLFRFLFFCEKLKELFYYIMLGLYIFMNYIILLRKEILLSVDCRFYNYF